MEKGKYKKIFKEILEKDMSQKKKVFYKPSKLKCIIGFIFTLFILIMLLLSGFNFSMVYLLVFFGDFIILVFFSLNLFTKEGFLLPKYVREKDEESEKE